MPFIGNKPAQVPLTSADITDSIITSAKIVDGTITNADVASSIITGQTVETSIDGADSVLIYDDSASALRKMTRTNFVSGLGAAAGQIIQVVTATDSTERTTNSTSFITGSNTLSATITPSSTSNKIFAICSFNCGIYVNSDGRDMIFTIYRGATDLGASSSAGMSSIKANMNGAGAYNISQPVCISVLDSPSTTSATTYQLYYRRTDNNFDITLNAGSRKGSMTLFEIKG